MKYIAEKGTVIEICEPSLLTRTLSFKMNDSGTFDSNKMADLIAKNFGLVKELKFRERFKFPDGTINHSYFVIFEVPWCDIIGSRQRINNIMRDFEDLMEEKSNVTFTSKHERK